MSSSISPDTLALMQSHSFRSNFLSHVGLEVINDKTFHYAK